MSIGINLGDRRALLLYVGAGLAGLLSVLAGVLIGAESLAPRDVLGALVTGVTGDEPATGLASTIVLQIRLPRVLLAGLVGGGLAVAGVAMQALVRNPLAEPYILGISSGASAGASLMFFGLLPPILTGVVSLQLAAFLGGLIAISIVLAISRTGRVVSVARLLLAGVAVSAMMAAITSFVTFLSPDPEKIRSILFWLLGSLSGTDWKDLWLPLAASLLIAGFCLTAGRSLDALLLGDEPAQNLGVRVESLKRWIVLLTALVTGVLVAQTGAIGFVGLVVPHSVRSIAGVGHRRLVPVSFVVGAVFLIWADILSRTIVRPSELPVGVLTALCGAPFFLYLLRRRDYRFG